MSYHFPDLYQREPNFYYNYFYIHKRTSNIGRMGGDNMSLTDSSLAKTFNSYKQGKEASLSKTLTNQYVQSVKNSFEKTSEALDLLNSVFDIENNNINQILNRLNEVMKDGLEQYLNLNNLIKLLQIENTVNWSAKKKSQNNSLAELEDVLNKGGKYYNGLSFLDNLLQAMADTVSLLKSPLGASLGAALLQVKTSDYRSVSTYGKSLSKALKKFSSENKGALVSEPSIKEAINEFQKIVDKLVSMKASEGNLLSKDSLQGSITKQFFPTMAEIIASEIQDKVSVKGLKMLTDAARTGAQQTSIQVSDEYGNLLDDQYFHNLGIAQGKADNVFRNVQLDLSSFSNEDSFTINMDLGISVKSYVSNDFGPKLFSRNNVFSLGGGMTLGTAFTLLLGNNNIYQKYLGYNIFAHMSELPQAVNALQDALLTRSIIYLAAGRGKEDFSHFIILNGCLLSIWDIIKYAINNNIGRTGEKQTKDNLKGIYMTFKDKPEFEAFARSKDFHTRVVDTNNSITDMVMKMHLNPRQIANMMP